LLQQSSAGVNLPLLLRAANFAADEKRGGFTGDGAQLDDGLEVRDQRADVAREVVCD
jgi:hypothetical protein